MHAITVKHSARTIYMKTCCKLSLEFLECSVQISTYSSEKCATGEAKNTQRKKKIIIKFSSEGQTSKLLTKKKYLVFFFFYIKFEQNWSGDSQRFWLIFHGKLHTFTQYTNTPFKFSLHLPRSTALTVHTSIT